MNQGIHDIDLLQWMMGPIERLYAEADTFLRPIEAEDMGAAVLISRSSDHRRTTFG